MTKGLHKKKSKRVPAKRRYNIEKKVREHKRKLKKQIRKKKGSKNKSKDPGIPNSLPFKQEIITEAQEEKRKEEERRQLMRIQNQTIQKQERDKLVSKRRKLDLDSLQEDAEARTQEFEERDRNPDEGQSWSECQASNSKTYYKEFHKVIEASDVVIEVLDARDPIGSRCRQVEEEVQRNGPNKRLILLLNKVDLVPRANLENWLKYLRNQHPTVAFKACTQKQNSNLSSSKVKVLLSSDRLLESSKCLGADILMKLLGNYCRNKDIKTSITVGLVGFPNVGKSSVINSLKRCHACSVGPTPGLTKCMQTVSLDKRIKLLDSPGIIFADNDRSIAHNSMATLALRNAVTIGAISDPIAPIEALLRRVNRQDLQLFYRLPAFNTVTEFLALLAKRFGKLKKGGVVDVEGAARKVLNDWNVGKIKYFTVPPETQSLDCHINAEIVSQISREFDINSAIIDQEMSELSTLAAVKPDEAIVAQPWPTEGSTENQLVSQQMELDLEGPDVSSGRTNIVVIADKSQGNGDSQENHSNQLKSMQLNKEKRLLFKKMKKNKRRQERAAQQLTHQMDNIRTDDYDFETDFN